MKKIFFASAFTALFVASATQAASWGNYTFPDSGITKDPVTGKSPNLSISKTATFDSDMAFAVRSGAARQITSEQHGCNWATTTQIYAFKDGAIYTEKASATYNIFPRDTVLKNGCWLPKKDVASEFIYPVTPDTQLDTTEANAAVFPVSNFKDLGIDAQILDNSSASAEIAIADKAKFLSDMARGVQVSQKAHGCPTFAKKPYIYAFNDAVVYARLDNATFSVYSRRVVETEKKCVLPKMSLTAPVEVAPSFNFARIGLTQNPEIALTDTTSTLPAGAGYLDKDYAEKRCNGSWSWKSSNPMVLSGIVRNSTVPGAPQIADWKGEKVVTFTDKPLVEPVTLVTVDEGFFYFDERTGNDRRGIREGMIKKAQGLCNAKALAVPKIFAFNPGQEVTVLGALKPAYKHIIDDAKEKRQVVRTPADVTSEMFDKLEAGNDFALLGLYKPFFKGIGRFKVAPNPKDPRTFAPVADTIDRKVADWNYFVAANSEQRKNFQYEDLKANRFTGEFISVKANLGAIPKANRRDYGTYWSGVQYDCEITVQPRVLKPKLLTFIPNENVPDSFTYEYKLSRYPTNEALVDSAGNPILGKTLNEALTLAPAKDLDGVCKVDRTDPSKPRVKCTRYKLGKDAQGRDLDVEVTKAADKFEAETRVEELSQMRDPAAFVCSSGDHIASLVVDEKTKTVIEDKTQAAVRAKYDFLYNSIVRYMKTVSLVDYAKRGYCQRVNASCTFDKSPELSKMLRNFQALRVEKQKYLVSYKEGFPIVNIEDFYPISENAVYPEHKL